MPSTNSGPMPIIAGNTHAVQVAVQENVCEEYLREYKDYVKVGKAILELTTNAFEPKCL